MDLTELVVNVAASLRLLDEKKQLVPLDSLTIVDFVTALEHKSGRTVPTSKLAIANFRSIETVVAMLSELK